MAGLLKRKIVQKVSGGYLTEELPDDYDDMRESDLYDFVKDHMTDETFNEGYGATFLMKEIERQADSWLKFYKDHLKSFLMCHAEENEVPEEVEELWGRLP